MEIEIVTKADLERFRKELLNDIRNVLNERVSFEHKEWFKAKEVRKILGISYGTLQNLRVKGMLKAAKIGGIYFYKNDDVNNLLLQGYNS